MPTFPERLRGKIQNFHPFDFRPIKFLPDDEWDKKYAMVEVSSYKSKPELRLIKCPTK